MIRQIPEVKIQAIGGSKLVDEIGDFWMTVVGMASPSISLQLNDPEFDAVLIQDPQSRDDGGFQRLMVTLQEITEESTQVMVLPRHLIPRLRRYAFDYGQGGWEDRIVTIFGRHFGPSLDQIPSD